MKFLRALMRREPQSEQEGYSAPPRFRSTARTHVGKVRSLNEDRLVDMPEAGLWAIADGMGGHRAGDVAAEMLTGALRRLGASDAAVTPDAAAAAVYRVNKELLQIGRTKGSRDIIGATVVVLIAQDGRYHILWAGDSRAYLVRGSVCRRVSRDHSLIQELVDQGAIRAADAWSHPQAHVVTRAVGAAASLQLDAVEDGFEAGDRILLCSDGLTDVIDLPAFFSEFSGASIDDAAEALIAAALKAGAPDNVTLVMVEALA